MGTTLIDLGGTVLFKDQPPPLMGLGSGSLEVYTPQDYVRMRNVLYAGSLLSSFTEFSYSTLIQSRSDLKNAPFIVLQIDLDDDGDIDDNLVFEPQFQTEPIIENVWQTWNAMVGTWWLGSPPPDPAGGGPFYDIASYLKVKENKNTKIVNTGVLGGIRLTAYVTNFKVNVDNFRIGIYGVTTVFDFENSIAGADAGPDQSVFLGYSNCTQLTGTATGGVAPYSYSWSPGGSSPQSNTTQVCPEIATIYTLKVTDANGYCRTDNVIINVHDVRCGKGLEKVLLCHHGEEICINRIFVQEHLDHGDRLGSCRKFPYERKFPVKILEKPAKILENNTIKTNTKIKIKTNTKIIRE
ncbi:SprB repeat-containing protein [Flavobacterium sp. ZS1P14]|uniref:SprB repeat-containing protein n=1 Tax=Flavobacterium sp. ZS1P14 TaxID=3401729 RepID=UPI003AAF48E2